MSFNKGFRNEVQYNGLKNQGATCYLNAVLQCLFMTPEFREAVESYEAPGDCGEENLLLQLQKLFTQLSEKAATTGGITKSLGIRSVFEQQDAVEYYRKILKAVGTHASKVFEGKMNNITKCGKCGNETTETNTFISMLLSIDAGNDKYDMEKSLKTFFEHSKLEEDDWMYCERCDSKTETETWSEIHEYPTVLALHLKRFDFDYIQMRYEKNECRLDVPLSLPKEDNRPRYDLYAVINHKGGYSGGHYNTIIRSYENEIWYRFDDCSVTQLKPTIHADVQKISTEPWQHSPSYEDPSNRAFQSWEKYNRQHDPWWELLSLQKWIGDCDENIHGEDSGKGHCSGHPKSLFPQQIELGQGNAEVL
ncbi:ubiquitin carboxyl-terminal hydrolase 47 isoform X7 [Ctenopharyngodon idella]|uniref:ubiquitin carboxyl-terminal hydrolase 47 isoform X7 n=1 Tax=Ctenopharyngodon idella TaxID=7959 RepID=UPI00223081E3|nr:ubiquitin carboxyl-terminal hydrolase 47 isoform X7 [Ctenopharyngodon idella]